LELDQSSAKIAEAKAVIQRCVSPKGFHASTQLYPELWVRDLVYSEDVLLRLGYGETIKRHLTAFLDLQRENGNLPTVITSFWRRSLNQTFHFWTCDTEILFVVGAFDYANYTGDMDFLKLNQEKIDRCTGFVNGRLNKLGLIPGTDWRDAILDLDGRYLLANQVQLANMYERTGHKERSKALMETIRDVYSLDDQGSLADSVRWDDGVLQKDTHFDCLGSALGVLNGTISSGVYSDLGRKFQDAFTGYGFRNVVPVYEEDRARAFRSINSLNAFVRNGAVLRNRRDSYQNSAVWPFVEARIVAALRKMRMTPEARNGSEKMLARRGMNEWYGPFDGVGHGSAGQLWTAAAVVAQAEPS
jgi:hypothetical protein